MRLTTKGLTSTDGTVELDRLNFVTGPVGSGKSRLADALRFLGVGFIPSLGKTPASVAQRMNGREMHVEAEHDGRVFRRTLRATGKGYETEAFASWVERGSNDEQSNAILSLFGPDKAAVAECLDVRQLINLTGGERQARLQQLLESGVSAEDKVETIVRYTVQRICGVEDARMPEDYRDLRPLIPPAQLTVLRASLDTLKGRLKGTGIVGALEWANAEKRAKVNELEKKQQAREVLLVRVQELPESTEAECQRLGEERDLIQQAVGAMRERIQEAVKKRADITAALAAADLALGAKARARKDSEEIAPRVAALAGWRVELAGVEAELDAMPAPPSLDLSEVNDLAERARKEDAAAAIPMPEIPSLVDLEAKLDRATREYNEAAESPWSEVARHALTIDGLLTSAKFKARAEVLAELDALQALALRHAQPLEGLAEQMRLYRGELDQAKAEVATVTAQRDAALEKARKHRAEAERLRKAAKEIEQDRRAAHEKASDEHAAKRGSLIARRDQLRLDIERTEKEERRTTEALTRATTELEHAEQRRAELGDTAPEIETGLAEKEAELQKVTAELETLTTAAAERETLTRIIREIDDLGAEREVFTALEAALKRARAEELAEAGGPLIKIMSRFLAGAGMAEVPYFDAKKDATEIGWRKPDAKQVPLAGMSSGQWVLFVAAVNAAVLGLRKAEIRPLLVEADNCDRPTLAALLRGIEAVADEITTAVVMTHQAPPANVGPWSVIDMSEAREAAAA